MTKNDVLIIGTGHLAFRTKKLSTARGHAVVHLTDHAFRRESGDESTFDVVERRLRDVDLASLSTVYLVDDRDERNLELLIVLVSLHSTLHIVASFFNENIAPHLQAAHPNVRILNPAKIAAPAFIRALDTPIQHALRYVPTKLVDERAPAGPGQLMKGLVAGFVAMVVAATAYFHAAESLSWLDALYFVVVTVATVGYGDISLLNSAPASKVVGIALILTSTCFIWIIFSLTIDSIIKRRVQLALGRKQYSLTGHVILCGLGRLGYFIAEGLLARGEQVLIVERNEDSPTVEHLRSRGASVYIGDARLPRVLQDVGVTRARALYSVINDDYANLEIGLNARSFKPDLRLILRIFDESMSQRVKQHLDIHLTFSMSAIADDYFLEALPLRPARIES